MTIEQIKGTWTYKHKHLLVTFSLIAVVLIQAFPISSLLPQPEAIAYEKTDTDAEVEAYIGRLEARAIEVYESRFNENMRAAMTLVLQEENDKLMQAALKLPDEDFSHLKQAINALEN